MSRTKRMRGKFIPLVSTDDNGRAIKQCSFCGEWKLLEAYPKNGTNEDGSQRYRDDCKTCYNIRRRENSTKKRHTDFVGGMKRRGEASVEYSHQQWKETVIFFGGECAYCGRTLRKGERLTRDHLVPVSAGGQTTQANIVPACSSCNSSKQDMEWREWFMQQAFFSQERMNRIFKWRSIMSSLEGGNDAIHKG
jgi:5-methylcytosine-specific restriction endonuclease McrA